MGNCVATTVTGAPGENALVPPPETVPSEGGLTEVVTVNSAPEEAGLVPKLVTTGEPLTVTLTGTTVL